MRNYPIPEIRLDSASGERLLDLGCNWGRWTIRAARKGYRVTAIDPDIGAILTARRVSGQLGVSADVLVAGVRHLPFPDGSFDKIFTHSVFQHLSTENVRVSLKEIRRVLTPEGSALVQMANKCGIRSVYH